MLLEGQQREHYSMYLRRCCSVYRKNSGHKDFSFSFILGSISDKLLNSDGEQIISVLYTFCQCEKTAQLPLF